MAVEKWKMENGDLGVKVSAPRVLLPFHFRPSVLIAYIYIYIVLNFTQHLIIHLVVQVIRIN